MSARVEAPIPGSEAAQVRAKQHGVLLMIRAIKSTPASTLAPFFYCHVIWALVFGHFFFDEFPDLATLTGAALVVASGLYVYRMS